MLEGHETNLSRISAHRIIHDNDSRVILSEKELDLGEADKELLMDHMVIPLIKADDEFQFTFGESDHELNPMFQLCKQVFSSERPFHEGGLSMMNHLLQCSDHPNIKSGDVLIMLIHDIPYEDELVEGIGLFKSESIEQFLKFEQLEKQITLDVLSGISVKKLDKATLIMNISESNGYIVKMIDKTNGNQEAKFWEQRFLNLKVCENAYHDTMKYMNLTQSYLSHQISEEFDIAPIEQKAMLKQSLEFFDSNQSFSQDDYKAQVLQNQDVVESFDAFTQNYQKELGVTFENEISVSPKAVKKNKKYFKSVLKLDKNFHIYIHGDHSMIERGKDPDGRKYYKVFYEEES